MTRKAHRSGRIVRSGVPEEIKPMADQKKCAHPACSCMTDKKYCSTYCEERKDVAEIACECGHAGCAGEIAK